MFFGGRFSRNSAELSVKADNWAENLRLKNKFAAEMIRDPSNEADLVAYIVRKDWVTIPLRNNTRKNCFSPKIFQKYPNKAVL